MKKVTAEVVNSCSAYTSIVFTTRLTTAMEMLDLEEKLHTEQETAGVWDTFVTGMYDAMEPYNVRADFRIEYFKGCNDVIFELTVIIQALEGCKHDRHSEQIAGTILEGLCNHMGWVDYYKPKLADSFDSRNYKNLAVFSN